MVLHLLKLVWNRRRSNLLLMLEIMLAFLVVFAVTATGTYMLDKYRQPMGFDYRDVWSIGVARAEVSWHSEWSGKDAAAYRRLVSELETLGPVTGVAAAANRPYSHSTHLSGWSYEGREITAEIQHVSDGYHDVLGLELVQGRWFEPADKALDWQPLVVNALLVSELFGDEDPIGRRMGDESTEIDWRVVGVVRAYRRAGEFSVPQPQVFLQAREDTDDGASLRHLVIGVAPGTRADFEEPLTERLQAIAPQWTFSITNLERERKEYFNANLIPLLIAGTVAGFLLLMVVLGLTGVLWQNVTRRTREIGLRRAVGAHRKSIHRQVVAEVMITASLALFLGSLVAVQVPVLGPFTFLPFGVVLSALVVAAVSMVLIAGACGLYPGWTATRIHPAEALHYE